MVIAVRDHHSAVSQRPRSEANHILPGVLAFLLFAACATLAAFYGTKPPAAVSTDAPTTEFSSGRAMEHVRRIGREPHPIGSPENTEVREYIFGELDSLGLDPQVQTATVVDEEYGSPYTAGAASNVLARIEGTRGGAGGEGAVMLAAHYDSVLTGPGANDDGAGVVALLETARALSSDAPLRNDVIFLFTDGEETGLLGAGAFVEEHPWAEDVGVALNFETRGSGGPSVMFETSANNRRLVEEFARAAPHPVASSATYEVYRRLPYDTDLTEFKEAGMAGLNFSYFRDATRYHTALDTPSSMDGRSLQHHGSYALAVARHFGNADLKDLRPGDAEGGDAVYFDVFGLFLVRYPAGWAVAFAVFVAIVFAGVVVMGVRRGLLTMRGALGGLLASLLALVLVPAVAAALLPLVRFLSGGRPVNVSEGDVYYSGLYSLGFLAVTLALVVALYGFAGRWTGARNLAVGAFVPWLVLCALSTALAPGVSFVFTWPPLLALTGLGVPLLLPDAHRSSKVSYTRAALLLLSGAAATALFAPLVYLLHLELTVGSAAVTMVFVVLGAGLLVGHVALVGTEGARVPWWVPVGLTLVAASLFTTGGLLSGFDAQHPRPDNIFYAFDADEGQATWATLDEETDAYTSRFVGPNRERGSLEDFLPFAPSGLLEEAPPLPLAAPDVEVLDDTTDGDVRTLRLRVSSLRGARYLSLWLESDDPGNSSTPVLSAAVNGELVEEPKNPGWGRWAMEYYALPEEGIELTLKLRPEVPVRLRIVDRSDGLPDVPGIEEARPPDTMPRFGDVTFVGKSFDLTEPGGSWHNRPSKIKRLV